MQSEYYSAASPAGRNVGPGLQQAYSKQEGVSERSSRRQVPREMAGLRVDQALALLFPEHSRSRLQGWLLQGHIRIVFARGAPVTAAIPKPKQRVWGGEAVVLEPPVETGKGENKAEAIGLDAIFEDDAILVINKPAGLVVHPGNGNWQGTLLNALLHHLPGLDEIPRAGIVHRLDKDTSGLLVVAKTLEAQTSLVRQLQARTVTREYLALVHGDLQQGGEVEAPIGRDPRQRTRMAVVNSGKPAATGYRVLQRFGAATLLECSLRTGRTHQIRVHMKSLGHPLVGDIVYGGRRRIADGIEPFERQALHAAHLALIHPKNDQPMRFEAPPPSDMNHLLETLRERCDS